MPAKRPSPSSARLVGAVASAVGRRATGCRTSSGAGSTSGRLRRELLAAGRQGQESRRITTSHHRQPLVCARSRRAGEEQGEVWFGVLAWSGNWKLAAEVTDFRRHARRHRPQRLGLCLALKPGETFTTPASAGRLHGRRLRRGLAPLHDYARDDRLPHGKTLHPVLYNSWEAVFFDVNEESQMAVAERAAAMGVELFVMDDGWFHGRDHDDAGLGDWWPDAAKVSQRHQAADRARATRWAWTSACGWSRRWSTRTANSTARTPTG